MDEDKKEEQKEVDDEKKPLSQSQTLEKVLQARLEQEKRLLGQDLDSDERTVIDCFRKPRLILERIYIIFNQTRNMLGKEVMKEKDLREILENLSKKGYITIEKFEYEGKEKEAFILTELGSQLLE